MPRTKSQPVDTQAAAAGLRVVNEALVNWQATRTVLAELEQAEHPDIIDRHGRVWHWKGRGDTYSHDDTLAIPREWIEGSNLPPETLAQNWNYHRLCAVCTAGWSTEALTQHAQNAIDRADCDRLGWDAWRKTQN